jgi:hypothetical protein
MRDHCITFCLSRRVSQNRRLPVTSVCKLHLTRTLHCHSTYFAVCQCSTEIIFRAEIYMKYNKTWKHSYNKVTHFTELSPSWEATNSAATHEFRNVSRNPKVHYSVHKSHPLVPVLDQINPVHITPCNISKNHPNIILSQLSSSS